MEVKHGERDDEKHHVLDVQGGGAKRPGWLRSQGRREVVVAATMDKAPPYYFTEESRVG